LTYSNICYIIYLEYFQKIFSKYSKNLRVKIINISKGGILMTIQDKKINVEEQHGDTNTYISLYK